VTSLHANGIVGTLYGNSDENKNDQYQLPVKRWSPNQKIRQMAAKCQQWRCVSVSC